MSCFFGVSIYGENRDKWWHKFLIVPGWKFYRILHRAKWWVRYRYDSGHQYHMIRTDLAPGYYDIDTVMLHGMFKLLDRYVDEERDGVDDLERWADDLGVETGQGKSEFEAATLYRWWNEVRPADHKRREELMSEIYGKRKFETEGHVMRLSPYTGTNNVEELYKELGVLEEKINREEDEMLIRLVKIRTSLWT
jgi:hypothetical protein